MRPPASAPSIRSTPAISVDYKWPGPSPNRVFALDAVSGDLKWSFLPRTDRAAQGVACCDVVNRGLAYDNCKIFLNTLDNVSIALDAKTGQELWHNKLGDINQ